jgi:hypothetical protein
LAISMLTFEVSLCYLSEHQWTKESSDEALRLFYRAFELDPGFASAYGMAAWCFVLRKANRWMADRAQAIAEATRLARRAVDLGADDATALSGAGYALAPAMRVSTVKEWQPFRQPDDLARLEDGPRKAGLPE